MASPLVEPTIELTRSGIVSTRSSQTKEAHVNHGEIIHDGILGFADGLTVPFALTAGLSSYDYPLSPVLLSVIAPSFVDAGMADSAPLNS